MTVSLASMNLFDIPLIIRLYAILLRNLVCPLLNLLIRPQTTLPVPTVQPLINPHRNQQILLMIIAIPKRVFIRLTQFFMIGSHLHNFQVAEIVDVI